MAGLARHDGTPPDNTRTIQRTSPSEVRITKNTGNVTLCFLPTHPSRYHISVNLTLSLEDHLVEKAREMATRRGTSLDQMIQELLEDATATRDRETCLEEIERLWERSTGDSKGRGWKREDLYDRPVLR